MKKFVGSGQNGSTSTCHLGRSGWGTRGTAALAKKVINKKKVATQAASNMSSTVGRQGVVVYTLNGINDLVALRTAANATVATEADIKLFMHESKNKFHLRSAHNSLITLTIYDIETKRQPMASAYDDPLEAWEKGLQDMGLAVGHSLNINQTPSFSAEFRRWFRIKGTTKVLMEPGQQHEHTVYHKINRQVDTTAFGLGNLHAAGLTTHCMFVFHGSLAHETAAPATVTYTAATIDVATFREQTFGFITQSPTSYGLTSTLPVVLVNGDMMGENQDADVDPMNA